MKFTNEEIKAAKQTRDAIISNNIEELKAIYMAGEICMWDELQQKKAMDYKKTLEQVMDLLNNAEELNMSNYDHDQVRLLNDTFIEVYLFIERALAETSDESAALHLPVSRPVFFDVKGREITDGCVIWNPADEHPEQSVKLIDGELWFGVKGTIPNEGNDWCKLDKRYGTEKFWLIVS